MFTEILSCDLFEQLFGVVGDLYQNAILPIAVALLLMILTWQVFKSMFGKLGTNSEDPLELVFRSGFCLFMLVYARDIVNYILEVAGTPYQWVMGTGITVDSFSGYVSATEAAVLFLGADALSISLLLLIMHIVVAWNYFKLLFILAERYVLLGVLSYTAPLAFATGGSKATNNILASWTKMFGGQVEGERSGLEAGTDSEGRRVYFCYLFELWKIRRILGQPFHGGGRIFCFTYQAQTLRELFPEFFTIEAIRPDKVCRYLGWENGKEGKRDGGNPNLNRK